MIDEDQELETCVVCGKSIPEEVLMYCQSCGGAYHLESCGYCNIAICECNNCEW